MYPSSHSLTLAHERQDYLRSGGRPVPKRTPAGPVHFGHLLRRWHRPRPQPDVQARPVLVSGGP